MEEGVGGCLKWFKSSSSNAEARICRFPTPLACTEKVGKRNKPSSKANAPIYHWVRYCYEIWFNLPR